MAVEQCRVPVRLAMADQHPLYKKHQHKTGEQGEIGEEAGIDVQGLRYQVEKSSPEECACPERHEAMELPIAPLPQ